MLLDALQVAGALAILIPYLWQLLGTLSIRTYRYLLANLAGASLLAGLAFAGQDWGFLLLEGCWAVAAAFGLASLARSPRGVP